MKTLTRKETLEQTRQKILKEASELFMSKGFKQTSTRDIAAKVGITQPALYHHFSNKLEIYEEVIINLTQDVQDAMEITLKKNINLEDKLFEIFKVLVIKHPTNLFKMINDIMSEMSKEKKYEMYQIWSKTYLAAFLQFVEEAQVKGVMRKNLDANKTARYLLSAISPLIEIESMFMERKDLEEEIRSIVDYSLYGILN